MLDTLLGVLVLLLILAACIGFGWAVYELVRRLLS